MKPETSSSTPELIDAFEDMPIMNTFQTVEREFFTLEILSGKGYVQTSDQAKPFIENTCVAFGVGTESTVNQSPGHLIIAFKEPVRRIRFGCHRYNAEGTYPTLTYHYNTDETFTTLIPPVPLWMEDYPAGDRRITQLEFYYPKQSDSRTYIVYLDNFTLYQ